mgnify:CR=1 FL=1
MIQTIKRKISNLSLIVISFLEFREENQFLMKRQFTLQESVVCIIVKIFSATICYHF